MTVATPTQTREIVRAYYDAWSRRDVEAASQYFAENLDFTGALRRGSTAAEYVDVLNTFLKLVTSGNDLISELYGDNEATLIYDSHTVAGTIRIAEHIRVADGTISAVNLILDPTAIVAFRASRGQ